VVRLPAKEMRILYLPYVNTSQYLKGETKQT
jgi:hypothetical protein